MTGECHNTPTFCNKSAKISVRALVACRDCVVSSPSTRRQGMTRLTRHIRSNAVAYLALFVALGGTSYAALHLPANSVGGRQIRNHVINPVKLNPKYIAGSVRAWASVNAKGKIVASSGGARIVASVGADKIRWNTKSVGRCWCRRDRQQPDWTRRRLRIPASLTRRCCPWPRGRLRVLVTVYAVTGHSGATPSRQPYVVAVTCPDSSYAQMIAHPVRRSSLLAAADALVS